LVPASDGTSVRGVVGEVAARLSGGFMSGWTYPLATGVPLTRAALRIALGEPIDPHELTPTRSQVVVERAAISAPGRVSSIEWAAGNASRSHGKPVDTFLHCRVGDEVEPPRNNVQKVANVIAVAADRGTAETLAVRSLDQLRIRLVPDNPETDAFVFRDGWRGPFARYELSGALNRRLDSLAPDSAGVTAGVLSEHRVVEFGGAIPVEPLTDTSLGGAEACRSRYPSIDASQIVAELLQTDRIRFEHGFSALGSAFWSALLSAGRQGVDYFLSAVERGSLRIYDTVNRSGSS
jgi:hypothetical protein